MPSTHVFRGKKRTLVLAIFFLIACGESATSPKEVIAPPAPALDAGTGTSTFSSVAGVLDGGTDHTCALRQNGTVVCWGKSPYGQMNVPANEVLMQISAGYATTCGIRPDGSVGCWGSDGSGQTNVPTSGTYTQVSAGSYQVCALNTDQKIVCWGAHMAGEAEFLAGTYQEVSAGGGFTCAISIDDTIACMGTSASPPSGTFLHISAGGGHACALRDDRSIVCWGNNQEHEVDGVPAGNDFREVSSGAYFSCGLRDSGDVSCWGSDGTSPSGGVTPAPPGPFVRMTTGAYHVCAQRASGVIVCWGRPEYLDVPSDFQLKTLTTEFGPLDAGPYHTCAIRRDGGVACWGHNPYGQQNIPGTERPTALSAGFATTCLLHADGLPKCYGTDGTGQNSVISEPFKTISAGYWSVCAIHSDGDFDGLVGCWGGNTYNQMTDIPYGRYKEVSGGQNRNCVLSVTGQAGCTSSPGFVWQPGTYLQISAGDASHTCAIRTDGTLACWGNNSEGELNNIPSGVYTQVSAGAYSTCALRDDGVVKCWGFDIDGSVNNAPSGQFVRMTMGALHGCAQRATGTIVCWGRNDLGQLNVPAEFAEVTNAPPVISLSSTYQGSEGSPVVFDASGTRDPDNDVLAYSWDFGDNSTGTGPTVSHTYADNGSYSVTLTVSDGVTSPVQARTTAGIANVPPNAQLVVPTPLPEGTGAGIGFIGQSDVGPADVAAGLRYAFDCGTGYSADSYATATPATGWSCPASLFTDGPASAVIKGKVFDKDGGVTESSATITVANVPPTLTLAGFAVGQLQVRGYFTFTDPAGTLDAASPAGYKLSVDWGDNTTDRWYAFSPPGGYAMTPDHHYPKGARYAVTITVEVKDGGKAAGTMLLDIPQSVDIVVSPTTVKKNTQTLSVGVAGSALFDARTVNISSLRLNLTPVAQFKGQPACATKRNATTGFYDLGCQFDVAQMRANGDLPASGPANLMLRGIFSQTLRLEGMAQITVQ